MTLTSSLSRYFSTLMLLVAAAQAGHPDWLSPAPTMFDTSLRLHSYPHKYPCIFYATHMSKHEVLLIYTAHTKIWHNFYVNSATLLAIRQKKVCKTFKVFHNFHQIF